MFLFQLSFENENIASAAAFCDLNLQTAPRNHVVFQKGVSDSQHGDGRIIVVVTKMPQQYLSRLGNKFAYF